MVLPKNQIFYSQNRPTDFHIDGGRILKSINGLNPHKAHGHDGLSKRMVKLCNLAMTKSLHKNL